MSLIEEALRRMQEPLVTAPPTPERAPKPRPAAAPEPPVHPWPVAPATPGGRPETPMATNPLLPTTLAVVILTVAMVIGGAVWFGQTLTQRPSAQPASPAVAALAPSAAPTPPVEAAPESAPPASPASAPEDTFALTGVVEGIGEPYAMINGVIVAVGERVGAATLLDIADGTVRLRLETGEERVLRVPR